jgi:predicted nucleic acid-binding protein
MNVFLDTNVVLDVLAKRQPFHDEAARIWALAERGRISALVSAVSVTHIYYIGRKLSSHAQAMDMLRKLRSVARLVSCDAAVVNRAIDAAFSDFEDAVQFFSARAANADNLVTRDIDHFPDDELPVLTPKAFLAAHSFE